MTPRDVESLFGDRRFPVMGIVNVTPDSFSDGGQFASSGSAIEHGLALAEAGADIVDIGGESTRPGSEGVDAATELERVVPVIAGLKSAMPQLLISIDTSKVEVAEEALAAGADVVNDVTAGGSPGMFELVARREALMVLMHMRGKPRTMQRDTTYQDVVAEVRDFLVARAKAARAAGVAKSSIIVDPGIGFGKDLEGNLALLRGLDVIEGAGYPILLGSSRKSFLGLITGAPVERRLGATLASLLPAFQLDRAILRVHDVEPVVQFRSVLEALGPI